MWVHSATFGSMRSSSDHPVGDVATSVALSNTPDDQMKYFLSLNEAPAALKAKLGEALKLALELAETLEVDASPAPSVPVSESYRPLDEGWLGPDPVPAVYRRVGDVILAARGPVGFIDPTLPYEAQLMAAHGSLTAAEMQVPLVASRGRGATRAIA